jgi:hypothetical protein
MDGDFANRFARAVLEHYLEKNNYCTATDAGRRLKLSRSCVNHHLASAAVRESSAFKSAVSVAKHPSRAGSVYWPSRVALRLLVLELMSKAAGDSSVREARAIT